MITWPAALPQKLQQDGYSEKLPDPNIKTQMDSGPEKKRPRYTAAPVPVQGSLTLTNQEVEILGNFYRQETKFGSLPFQWVHPRTQEPASFRFKEGPQINASNTDFSVALSLEILP